MAYLDEVEPGDEPGREASWEERGRAEKVRRICESLDAGARRQGFCPTADAETIARGLRGLSSAAWHKIQHEAGLHRRTPPSQKTRDAVIAIYERRVDVQGGESDG